MITCTRRLEWDAAHRVLRHESKCAHLHGHRYAAEITCAIAGCCGEPVPRLDVCTGDTDCVSCGASPGGGLDSVGRVVDFGVVKELVGGWIDATWDHGTLVNSADLKLLTWCLDNHQRVHAFAGEPTAENIALLLLDKAQQLLPPDLVVVRVRVYETPNCYAEATP